MNYNKAVDKNREGGCKIGILEKLIMVIEKDSHNGKIEQKGPDIHFTPAVRDQGNNNHKNTPPGHGPEIASPDDKIVEQYEGQEIAKIHVNQEGRTEPIFEQAEDSEDINHSGKMQKHDVIECIGQTDDQIAQMGHKT
jgi:hypothetical protein